MPAVLHGTQVSFGPNATAIVPWGGVVSQGETVKAECDSKDIPDAFGNTLSRICYNQRESLSLKCYLPAGIPSVSTASVGQQVAVTSSTSTDVAGDWILTSVTTTSAIDDVVTLDVELERPNFLT